MEGAPPAAPVYRDDRLIGYVFSTFAAVGTTGYSGKPLDVIAGVGLDGVITGARLRRHEEPILVIGIAEEQLAGYVAGFAGTDLRTRLRTTANGLRSPPPAVLAGATVSSAVIGDGIVRAGRAVARSRSLFAAPARDYRLDTETFEPAEWSDLVADGSIVRRRITEGDVLAALGLDAEARETPAEALFVDLYLALVTPPRIGENLLGKSDYTRLVSSIGTEDQAILIAANGRYSFKGTEYVRSGRFNRIQIVQDDKTFPLLTQHHRTLERLHAEGAPEFREIGLFTLVATDGFDPLRTWRLDLQVSRKVPGRSPAAAVLPIVYDLPNRYRLLDAGSDAGSAAGPAADLAGDPPGGATTPDLWQDIWRERWGRIAVLVALLAALSAILVVQDLVAARRRRYRILRLALLTFTLIWLGWYAGGQLSVVNVLTFGHALMSDFRWEFFLLDPVIFILWSYVAVTLLFLGRGVFCGWLCPFGALQELLNEAARMLRVPQFRLPFPLHERLWPIKYIVFLGLFAVSLNSMSRAFVLAEVEPFKTVISLRFDRTWPFVLYATILLAAGLFVERFFCRYLCPLGAALAIPARLRMFEWLKRRPQCGRECAICFHRCPVQSIHPTGAINPNECIYCLNCQVQYFDDEVCPPLVAQRRRRERRQALSTGAAVDLSGG
jgi:transcriptional regulator of nitric oxide reductase